MRPSIERLRELFDYDQLSGVLIWRSRPREDFPSFRAWRTWQAQHQGKPAGCRAKGGLTINVRVDRVAHVIWAHRLIWALAHGRWPVDQIDHRNGDPSDNRLANLREATVAQNAQNRPSSSTRGVGFAAGPYRRKPFQARIGLSGRNIFLGSFSTREEAHAAYLDAKATLHTFQPVPRERVM